MPDPSFRGEIRLDVRDISDAVSKRCHASAAFTGGRVMQVEVALGDDQYADLERDAGATPARE
jgi:hypothetical protein